MSGVKTKKNEVAVTERCACDCVKVQITQNKTKKATSL